MLRLDKVIKPWKDAAALNDHINLYGFWNKTTFLTKSGDLGMVLSVPGVDYESLDRAAQEYAVKRLEAALKAFRPRLPRLSVSFQIESPGHTVRRTTMTRLWRLPSSSGAQFFEAKKDRLYQIEILYAIVLEGSRSKTGVGAALAQLFRDPAGGVAELKAQFTNNAMKVLLRSQIETGLGAAGPASEDLCAPAQRLHAH